MAIPPPPWRPQTRRLQPIRRQAEPYFIRGQSLIVNATVDKTGKIIAPPGCAEAYRSTSSLLPTGRMYRTATDILTSLGETIHSSYKAKKN